MTIVHFGITKNGRVLIGPSGVDVVEAAYACCTWGEVVSVLQELMPDLRLAAVTVPPQHKTPPPTVESHSAVPLNGDTLVAFLRKAPPGGFRRGEIVAHFAGHTDKAVRTVLHKCRDANLAFMTGAKLSAKWHARRAATEPTLKPASFNPLAPSSAHVGRDLDLKAVDAVEPPPPRELPPFYISILNAVRSSPHSTDEQVARVVDSELPFVKSALAVLCERKMLVNLQGLYSAAGG